MIEPSAGLQLTVAAPQTLVALEIWGDGAAVQNRWGAALPAPCRSAWVGEQRVIWWEPNTWLLGAPLEALAQNEADLRGAVGADGAVTDLSGAFTRICVTGPLWRDLLMIGGVFDAESPGFGPGCIAGTVIHHLPVRLDVISDDAVNAYIAPSYAEDLLHHWTRAAARLQAA